VRLYRPADCSAGLLKTKSMKNRHIIFRPSPHIDDLLRSNAAHQERSMTDLIEGALQSYLNTPEGEYPDKITPLPVALQTGHLDAHFFDIHVGEKSVWGKFEADTVQPFELSIQSVLDAAYIEGLLTDVYEDGTVCTANSHPDTVSGRGWVRYFLDQFPGTDHFGQVFRRAVWAEFEQELHEIAVRLSSFTGRVEELRLVEVLQAARDLARICGAVQKGRE